MLVIVNANSYSTNFCSQNVTLAGCDPNQSRSQNQMQNTQKVRNVPDLNYELMEGAVQLSSSLDRGHLAGKLFCGRRQTADMAQDVADFAFSYEAMNKGKIGTNKLWEDIRCRLQERIESVP